MFPLADRVQLVSESITLAVSAKANALKKAGVDVVGFGAGEPDFDTPDFIKDAAKAALDRGATKYTPTPCIAELKAAIAQKFNGENHLPYKPENITTGAGGKHCLYMAFQAILNPGDEVIIPAPYWVSYPEQVRLAGGVPKVITASEANGFKITPGQLAAAITPKTKVFLINSPSNPAGHAYTPAIDAINKLQSQMTSHITSFVQPAAVTALTDPRGAESVEKMRQQFEKRGRHMWQRLSALPQVTCVRPQGAFYCFPNVSAYFGKSAGTTKIADAVSFAAALLEQNHVAVVPGNDSGFETHVRLSFATSMPNIDKGLDRLTEFLKKLM